jgi:hypothetical protein
MFTSRSISLLGGNPWSFSMLEALWKKFYPENLRLWLMGENEIAGGALVLKNHHGSLMKLLGINRDLKTCFPIAKYLAWKESVAAASDGLTKVSLGSTPSDPEEVHHLVKLGAGASFKPQEIIWFPLSTKGCLFLQTRSITESGWLKLRSSLPRAIRVSVEKKLIKI